jgi:hypothetical protein
LKEGLLDSQLLYESGFFSTGSSQLLKQTYNAMLLQLRPQVIPLIELHDLTTEDSWNISTIGNKYGDIFDSQLNVAKHSRLNTGKPPPYYEKLMKPIIQGHSAKL